MQMNNSHRRRWQILAVAGSLILPLLWAAPATAAPVTISAQSPLDAANVRGSLTYLMTHYHVSTAEAMRRLELQRYDAQITPKLAATFGSTYAGSWIDQDHGGVLVINSTEPSTLAATVGAAPDSAHIRLITVKRSLRQLESIAATLSARFAIPPAVAPVIDVVDNQLSLPSPAAARVAAMGGLAATGYSSDVVRAVQSPSDRSRDLACSMQNCTPPMRGGLKLYLFQTLDSRPNWDAFCTNGFNVHGSNGWQYTVTAGHCVSGIDNDSDNNSQWVGYYNGPTYAGDSYPLDGAIMPYIVTGGTNYATYWLGGSRRTECGTPGSVPYFRSPACTPSVRSTSGGPHAALVQHPSTPSAAPCSSPQPVTAVASR